MTFDSVSKLFTDFEQEISALDTILCYEAQIDKTFHNFF